MGKVCIDCREAEPPRTAHERHQLAADNGVDTWEELRCER
jgi:hypothetical protein